MTCDGEALPRIAPKLIMAAAAAKRPCSRLPREIGMQRSVEKSEFQAPCCRHHVCFVKSTRKNTKLPILQHQGLVHVIQMYKHTCLCR